MALARELEKLEAAVRREKAAPDILPYKTSLVATVVGMIDAQQAAIDQPVQSAQDKLINALYQLDLDRVKYLLSSYLRTRLFKIQDLLFYIVNNEDQCALLSDKELEFAEKYFLLKTNHFKKRLLLKLPDGLNRLEDTGGSVSYVTAPNLDKYVFARVLEDIGPFRFDGVVTQMYKDDLQLIPYEVAAELLREKKVDLV